MAELLDEEALTLMHENSTLVQLKDRSCPFNLFQDLVPAICHIDDVVCLIIGASNTDVLGRVRPIAVVGVIKAFFVWYKTLFAELRQIGAKVWYVLLAVKEQ